MVSEHRKSDLRETSNSQVWKKIWKTREASCGHCPWHRGENARRHDQAWKSWKFKTKNRRQYL